MSSSNHTSSHGSQSLIIDNNICAKFRAAKKFNSKETKETNVVTSLDYDDTGNYLVSTSTDRTLQIYDVANGKHIKSIYSKKYGCDIGRYTHSSKSILHASTIDEPVIRQVEIESTNYKRYFTGHKAPVTSMEVSPINEIFISSSLDNTIRLWDFRASNQQAQVPFKGPSKLAFDPSGMVVCASSLSDSIAGLFDVRNLDAGPFKTMSFPNGYKWNKVEFSNDNKYILFSCTNGNHLIYDSFDCNPATELTTGILPPSEFPTHGTSAFTPDGKYVFAATQEGFVGVFDLKTLDPKTNQIPPVLNPIINLKDDLRPRNIIFNPKYLQFTTADVETFMWVPTI